MKLDDFPNVRPERAQDLAQGNALGHGANEKFAALKGQDNSGFLLPLQGG